MKEKEQKLLAENEQLRLYNVSNTCSGCNQPKPTVKRHMFDGMCADCTDKALYDYDFAKRAERRNEELKGIVANTKLKSVLMDF